MRKMYSIEVENLERQFKDILNDIERTFATKFYVFEGFAISVPLNVYRMKMFEEFLEKIESLCIKYSYERSFKLEQVFTEWSTFEEYKNSKKIIFRHRSANIINKEKSDMVFDKMTKSELVAIISEYIKKVSDLEEINKLLDANISKQKEKIDELENANEGKTKYLKSVEKIPRMEFIREIFAGILTDMVFDGRTKEEMSILYDFTREFIDRYNKKTKEGLRYD